MDRSTAYKRLQYEHEVLWARYEIRDQHLKKIGEKIYDDIGQVLSLVRIQLCRAGYSSEGMNEATTESGELVGNAIRGLRAMHRSFYPETELLQKTGLLKTLASELELGSISTNENVITVQGTPRDLAAGTQLIVFRMLQEILYAIEPGAGNDVAIQVTYEERVVRFSIGYKGRLPEWRQPVDTDPSVATRLTLPERTTLIEGSLAMETEETGRVQITLAVPFKTSIYES